MMIHDAAGIEIGNASDMRTMADLLDKCSDNIADIYLQHAGGTIEQWRAAMQAETWYSADEALAAGLADVVNNADEAPPETVVVPGDDDEPDEETLMSNAWDLSFFRYAGREAAPAPVTNTQTPAEPDADTPVAPTEVAAEDATPNEPAAPVAPAPADEPDTPIVEEPAAEPEPVVATNTTDAWAAMTRGLLTDAAPSTVDDLLAALRKEGTPA
jgi:hypothetical protein